MSMFEFATRHKFRFPYRGMVSTEDLWDINVEGLDTIYKQLNSQVKQANEESLLNKRTAEDEVLNTQIEIVKHIVEIKLTEEEARKQAKAKKAQKQKILEIIADKQDAALQGKSVAELTAMLDQLG